VCVLWGQKITALKNKALKGDSGSQLQLGFLYSKGPLEDKKEALYWMTMAAREGMPSACRYLGFAYLGEKERPTIRTLQESGSLWDHA